MPVAADKELSLGDGGAFQNGVIVRIGRNELQRPRYRHYLREEANLLDGLRYFGRLEAALELEFLREFIEDGFAGGRETFSLARGLHAGVRTPGQPRAEKRIFVSKTTRGIPFT